MDRSIDAPRRAARIFSASLVASLLLACSPAPQSEPRTEAPVAMSNFGRVHATTHRGGDDLLSAGLGLDGLRAAQPPALADPQAPTAAELRRRAVWSNWRGIADLVPGGGFGEVYGALPSVPGREFHALARLPEARQPHRVLLQLPDDFDAGARCLVVTASSGSRGIYGAISLAGGWGLPRGCAVAYTDKGAGTGYFDLAAGEGAGLDGLPSEVPEFDGRGFVSDEPLVALKHAHSGDHPEADWGRHLRQAAEFALAQLSEALPAQAPFTFDNTRVIAVGVSNGAAAVLRAAADADEWLDAAVAIAANTHVAGSRPAYDYGSEAALLMPCALLHPRFESVPFARVQGAAPAEWLQACAVAQARGWLPPGPLEQIPQAALERLHAGGWTDEALAAGAISVAFDMWRSVGATYASAYLRRGPADMPCGFRHAAIDAEGAPRAAAAAERALRWSDASGIAPSAGVVLLSPQQAGVPPALAGLDCLHALWNGEGDDADTLRTAIAATRAGPPRPGLPLVVMHGLDDGLIAEAFSSAAYVAQAEAAGRPLRYWLLPHVQHFDAFLGLPALASRYLPLMPYAYRALDETWADLEAGRGPREERRRIDNRPRGFEGEAVPALGVEHLGLD